MTNLIAWELWNEFNHIELVNVPDYPTPSTFKDDLYNWHSHFHTFIKNIDPYKHFITTSCSGGISNWNYDVFSLMDIVQSHDYKNPIINPLSNFQEHFYSESERHFNSLPKPYKSGEWGFIQPDWIIHDPNGLELHNSLWSSAFSGAYGCALNWWWNSFIDIGNLYYHFQPISDFMNSLELLSSSFVPFHEKSGNNRIFYLSNLNKDTIYGCVQNDLFAFSSLNGGVFSNYLHTLDILDRPTIPSGDMNFDIDVNHTNFNYNIEWYDTESGIVIFNESIESDNGILHMQIPLSIANTSKFGDIAFKIFLDCSINAWHSGLYSLNQINSSKHFDVNPLNGNVFFIRNDNVINLLWFDDVMSSWGISNCNYSGINAKTDITFSTIDRKVYYITMDNNLNYILFDTISGSWFNYDLSELTQGNVKGPISINQNGRVFYRTFGNELNSIYIDQSGMYTVSELNNSSSNVGGSIFAVVGQVFYQNGSNQLCAIYFNPTTSLWEYSNLNNVASSNVCGNLVYKENFGLVFKSCQNVLTRAKFNTALGLWEVDNLDNVSFNVDGDILIGNGNNIFYRTINGNLRNIYFETGNWHLSNLNHITDGNVLEGRLKQDNYGNIVYRTSDYGLRKAYHKNQCFNIPAQNFRMYEFQEEILLDSALTTDIYDDIIFYPNPTSGVFRVLFRDYLLESDLMMQIICENGKKYPIKFEVDTEYSCIVDLQGFPTGNYILVLTQKTNVIRNIKFILTE